MTSPADLLDLSFKEIQDLEREIGLKEFQRRYGEVISNTATKRRPVDGSEMSDDDTGADGTEGRSSAEKKTKKSGKKKKLPEKWEPVEMSSKVKPKNLSGPAKPNAQKTAKIRDPRFDDVCGTFDKDLFEKVKGLWERTIILRTSVGLIS